MHVCNTHNLRLLPSLAASTPVCCPSLSARLLLRTICLMSCLHFSPLSIHVGRNMYWPATSCWSCSRQRKPRALWNKVSCFADFYCNSEVHVWIMLSNTRTHSFLSLRFSRYFFFLIFACLPVCLFVVYFPSIFPLFLPFLSFFSHLSFFLSFSSRSDCDWPPRRQHHRIYPRVHQRRIQSFQGNGCTVSPHKRWRCCCVRIHGVCRWHFGGCEG